MKVDSDTIDFSKTPEIPVSFRKKAVIKVFTSKQVSNLFKAVICNVLISVLGVQCAHMLEK